MSVDGQARALVARLLNGHLDAVTHTDQAHTLRFPSPYLPFRYAPATAVASVKIGGDTLDATLYSFTPHLLVREDGGLWPASPVLVAYTTGWAEGSEPAEVEEAIALAEQYFGTNPGSGVTSFREGNEAATVTADPLGPGVIRSLLASWVRP